MNGAFNQVVVRLSPGANERDTIAAMDQLLARNGSLGAHGRMDQLSYRFLHEEFRQLATMTRVFPTIFLGVAAFLLNVVFTRLVGTQRDQVAILKAFGYSTLDVALHYGLIVTLICLLGSALGVAGGAWLGTLMAAMYQTYFRFPFLDFNLSAPVVLAGIGVSLVAALLGTGRAVTRRPTRRWPRPCARRRRSVSGARWPSAAAGALAVAADPHHLSPDRAPPVQGAADRAGPGLRRRHHDDGALLRTARSTPWWSCSFACRSSRRVGQLHRARPAPRGERTARVAGRAAGRRLSRRCRCVFAARTAA